MNDQWVVNASPLIILAQIGRQHLLTALPEMLVVPQAVVDEINEKVIRIALRQLVDEEWL